jgi:hypothetical protein
MSTKRRSPGNDLPGGLPWEIRTDELGLEIVDTIGHSLTLDEEWCTRDERGFTWWGHELAQRVWSEPGFDDDGFEIFRLHAQTDVLRDFDASAENLATLNALAGFATTSGHLVDEDAGTVRLAASMYAHAETEDWVRRTFQFVVAMQAADAQIKAGVFADALGATVAATPHPTSGPRPEPDAMLDVLRDIVAPRGELPSAWEDEEMEWTLNVVRRSPHTVLATGSETGISAEFPFQSRTSLLTVTTEARNPQLGNGALLLLHLPMTIDEADGIAFATDLNRRELESLTRAHFLGSWHWRDDGLHFVTFLPSVLYLGRGSLLNLVMAAAGRAKWVAETFYGDDWEANVGEDDAPLATPAALDLTSLLFREIDE